MSEEKIDDKRARSVSTYIILLNYNSWQDTSACIDSLFNMDAQDFCIVICDNASTNDSLCKIHEKIVNLHSKKNISYACYDNDIETSNLTYTDGSTTEKAKIVLIENNENRGFSAGNNIGIRFAMRHYDCRYIWLLNNDTEVHPNALTELLNSFGYDENLMMTSSVCCEFNERGTIQCIGGRITPWIFETKGVGEKVPYRDITQVNLRDISILAGPSVMIRARYFKDIRKDLDERYDFYFEEADIAKNIRDKGYAIQPCLNSIVYHRGGHTTSQEGKRFGIYHSTRSKFLFVLKFYPNRLPFVTVYTIVKMIYLCIKGNFSIVGAMMKGITDALQWHMNRK